MQPYIDYEMPECDYHNHQALNQSTVKEVPHPALETSHRSLKHFKQWLDNGGTEATGAMTFGSAFHLAVLEPDRLGKDVIAFRETKTRGVKFDKVAEENPGCYVLLGDEYDMLMRMQDSFFSHPLARHITKGAKLEASAFWTDPATQLDCKARIDILHNDSIYDVKTARDASYAGFKKSGSQYGYDQQGAWYQDAAMANGFEIETVGFVVAEKESAEIQIFIMDQSDLDRGREKNRLQTAVYAHCLRTSYWPGYPQTVQPISFGE